MGIIIKEVDPRENEITALLHQSHALMQELFDPEDNHYLAIEELVSPKIYFVAAFVDDIPMGTGALSTKGREAEVKSMFTASEARGKGVGQAVLSALINHAKDLGLGEIYLETGNVLHAAHRLYERNGFVLTGPFGEYQDTEASVFYKCDLGPRVNT